MKSDTVKHSLGTKSEDTEELIGITRLTELTQDIIDSLNEYIEEDPDEYGTTEWKKWRLDKKGNPKFVQ